MLAARLFILIAAVALLTACGRSPVQGGFNPSLSPLVGGHPRTAPASERRASWMRPGAQRETLLYVSESNGVAIYSNPSGDTFQLAGELLGFQLPSGECVDGHGNVFIEDETAQVIVEYAHGAVTPKAVIHDGYGQPYTCSIDRKTGRLAVVNVANPSGSEPGNVLIYSSPTGSPTEYSDSHLYVPLFCSFNSKGDLYLDAYDSGYHGELSKLPNGSQSFTMLTLSGGTMNVPGGLAFNGSQLLVGDSYNPKTHIYETTVRGSTATITGTIALSQTQGLPQYSLLSSGSTTTIIAPDYDYNTVNFYAFPGGSFLGSLGGSITLPFAAVVSQGPPAQ